MWKHFVPDKNFSHYQILISTFALEKYRTHTHLKHNKIEEGHCIVPNVTNVQVRYCYANVLQ